MKHERIVKIAIDGPAAAGKSTVAKKIAQKLSILYIDTGAMYRALTLKALKQHFNVEDEQSMVQLLKQTKIELIHDGNDQFVYVDGENVSAAIRHNDVSNAVPHVAKHEKIREEMVKMQRKLADNVSVIMDGRDIGTNVLPDADVKIFLIASVDERAKRRHEENIAKGLASNLTELKKEIYERDERDRNRVHAPLKKAADAISIDTTSLTIDEVTKQILQLIEQKINVK